MLSSKAVLADQEIVILMLGDSLTAGYGLPQDYTIPSRLERALKKQNINVRVINGGVSGDTSAGGRSRLSWLIDPLPTALIVELGANDGLRGIDPKSTFSNLDYILRKSKAVGLKVLLTGMRAPPNLGQEYGREFLNIFPILAEKYQTLFYPFFLEGVAAKSIFNQDDGIHPNKEGVDVIVGKIIPIVKRLIKK